MSEEAFFLERLLDQTGLNRVGPGVIWAPIPRWVRVRLRVGPQAHSLILEISPLQKASARRREENEKFEKKNIRKTFKEIIQ